jgi:uncharacterized lipoprotein YmbA
MLLITAAMGSGCFSPRPDHGRFFVLTAEPPGLSQATVQGPRTGLRRVELPEYLQSKQLAVRHGHQEIRYLAGVFWGERLDKGLERALALNLESRLGGGRIVPEPWRTDSVDCELTVTFDRFEVDEKGVATVESRWQVTRAGGTNELQRARIEKQGPEPARDPAGAVTALNQALGELCDQVAKSVSGASTAR